MKFDNDTAKTQRVLVVQQESQGNGTERRRSSANEFQAKCRGLYMVKEKLGNLNYEITILERGSKVVHINLLKKWHQREMGYTNVI